MKLHASLWSIAAPIAGCALVAATLWLRLGWTLMVLVAIGLVIAVFAAVHHAELIARRVGEPFGTLVLALAVTVIEVGLIASLMLSGGSGASVLARDTVFATVMIVCNGVVGLCLLVGGIRHHVVAFQVEGTGAPLSVLAALSTLTLVMPALTVTEPGPIFSPSQLVFAGIASLTLYGVFVFVQTVRHPDDFLPVEVGANGEQVAQVERGARPLRTAAITSLVFLLLSLAAVVGLATGLAPAIRAAVDAADAPAAVVGIAIALLVLLPETSAAVRAAARNRMQTSLNLALGSSLATIGLTIPAVAALSIHLGMPLVLGLPPKERALLGLTLLISAITLATGRTTVLHGAVHLVLFAAFLFLAVVP